MGTPVFVFASHANGQLDDSVLELRAASERLLPGASPIALLPGSGIEALGRAAAEAFAEVWIFDDAALAYPNAELLRLLLAKVLPPGAVVLLPHNSLGMDLGPGLAVKLGAAYVPDVVGAEGPEGPTLKIVRQEYSGQVSAHVHADVSAGAVITVRSGAFRPSETKSGGGAVADHSSEARGLAARRRFLEVLPAEAGDVDITREEVLVSVGRGIGDKENLPLVEELAQAMGAGLACSRPIVDAKWLEKARQVGTSGQTVKPKVYLALGISGSFQHLGGLKGNPFLIAVNKNPKAPIFQAASVGVVVDLLELVPILAEKIRKGR